MIIVAIGIIFLLLFLFNKTYANANQDSGFFPVSHNHNDTYSDLSDSSEDGGGM
ncbi:hypothetical protein [Bacillus changyiensis]|uniref:hypothetical protein n=1 Tax=Bacillus changyiensis TaxID=3004103 RepID=UPI0022E98859|nr:hypothetical protein [Bacillus changyiensis]MDA1476847.1 hypothetical protein [Bacillus changyiensis]